jgi:hypothetical protein
MAEITLETVHDDLVHMHQDIIRLEAKIDGKPSLMAMFTGIVIVVFGMAGVIASTIATLAALHAIR